MQRTVLLFLVWLAVPASASDTGYWEYGDWTVYAEFSESEEHTLYNCTAVTGGDGEPAIRVYFNMEPGGYFHEPPSMVIEESAPRHYRTVMQNDERAYIVFDDGTGAYTQASSWFDSDGIEVASMWFTGPELAEILRSMRARDRIDVVANDRHIMSGSLTGFTAALLKMSEQCGFDPDRPTG